MRALVLIAWVSLVLAACTGTDDGTEPSAAPTSTTSRSCPGLPKDVTSTLRDVVRTIDVDGKPRQFLVHVPRGYDGSRPLPVVHLYHGLGSSAAQMVAYSGFAAAADEQQFLLVSPQALGDPTTWDVETPATTAGSDAAFWLQLAEQLGDEWCVDADRQYASGMSNGSAVVFAMACSGDFPFRAYAGVAATFYEAQCQDAPPASMLYFHGTADEVVPYGGGRTPLFPVRAAPAVIADWAEHDGCDARPRSEDVASDVEHTTWTGCDDASRLEAYVVEGGGHTWPGAELAIPPLGRTTSSIDATDLIVDFFGLGE